MSVAYILNNTYSYVENSKLNPALEVATSLKAPIHYVDDLTISKTESGNMSLGAPVVEATQIEAPIAVIDTVNTESIIPKSGEGGPISVLGTASISGIVSPSIYVQGAGTTPEVVVKNADDETQIILSGNGMFAHGVSCLTAVLGGSTVWGQEEAADGTITLKDIDNVQKISLNAGTGVVSAPVLASTKYSIPTITPVAGQVLASSDTDGTLYWKTDATGTTPTIQQVLQTGDNAEQEVIFNLSYVGVNNTSNGIVVEIDGENNQISSSTDANIQGFNNISAKNKLDAPIIDGSTVKANLLITSDPLQTELNVDTDVNMGVHTLNLSKITIPDLTPVAGQVLAASATDGTLYWKTDATGDVSQWATFQAVQNVNMNNRELQNVSRVNTSQIFSTGGSGQNEIVLRLNGADPTNRVLISGTGNLEFGSNGNIVGCGVGNISSINCSDYNGTSGNQMSFYPAEDAKVFNIFGETRVRNSDLYVTGGNVRTQQLIPTYKPLNTLWVSSNNTFTQPNGSYENPYTTIQDAINYVESVYDNTYWYINVLAGTYSGFTVSKKIFIKGAAPSSSDGCSVGCQINSDITVAIDANDGDMFNNQFSLSSFLVAGAKIVNTSTARHVVNITDCYFYNDSGTGRVIDCRPASTDCRLIILNSKIVNVSPSAGDALVEMSVGMARFLQCQFQCAGVQNVVKFSGTSRVDSIVLCSFTSTNASAVIPAIIEITSNTASAFTFGNCSFVYTSSTNKTANPSSCAIYANSAATSTIITIVYNTFALAGTSNSSNFVVNHGVVPCITLFFSNCATLNTTHTINGNNNSTKFSLQAVA